MGVHEKIPVAVVNGTGYGGVELLRLLQRHPAFELVEVTARSEAGQPIATVFPHLADCALTFSERVERAELVFVALPDHAAVEMIPHVLAEGRRVVDLSAAFRLRDAALYPRWYGYEHPAATLLEQAVFGLAEFAREMLPQARLVACPGCYVTTTLLSLAPAFFHHLIEPDVIVDAKSGTSGAGRSLKLPYHFSEANEDVSAYGLNGHRHQPEIAQELARYATMPVRLAFTPHLVPMTRGILATSYATLRPGVSAAQVTEAYAATYADAPFVTVAGQPPHTKWTFGSNRCFVYPVTHEDDARLVVIGVLDNLMKGAAGQAVQCANLMYGLSETAGLPLEGVFP
jgi:N-acetyl-gamma-glutamyl-phosphate reductase